MTAERPPTRLIGHRLGAGRPEPGPHGSAPPCFEALARPDADGEAGGLGARRGPTCRPTTCWKRSASCRTAWAGPTASPALSRRARRPLARRFDCADPRALESRLAARVHLRPLDADEAAALARLDCRPGRTGSWPTSRGSIATPAGNPGRCCGCSRTARAGPPRPSELAGPAPAPDSQVDPPDARSAARLAELAACPAKPPLRRRGRPDRGRLGLRGESDDDVDPGPPADAGDAWVSDDRGRRRSRSRTTTRPSRPGTSGRGTRRRRGHAPAPSHRRIDPSESWRAARRRAIAAGERPGRLGRGPAGVRPLQPALLAAEAPPRGRMSRDRSAASRTDPRRLHSSRNGL